MAVRQSAPMTSTTSTIAEALARLDETIERKKGADLPSAADRKALRVNAGLSARDLGDVLGINHHTIYTWEQRDSLPRNGNSQVYSAVLTRLAEIGGQA